MACQWDGTCAVCAAAMHVQSSVSGSREAGPARQQHKARVDASQLDQDPPTAGDSAQTGRAKNATHR